MWSGNSFCPVKCRFTCNINFNSAAKFIYKLWCLLLYLLLLFFGTCYINRDLIGKACARMWFISLQILANILYFFPRGYYCWKNRLKNWIPPILLMCVAPSISLLNSRHWKKTVPCIGKSVSQWMTEMCLI